MPRYPLTATPANLLFVLALALISYAVGPAPTQAALPKLEQVQAPPAFSLPLTRKDD